MLRSVAGVAARAGLVHRVALPGTATRLMSTLAEMDASKVTIEKNASPVDPAKRTAYKDLKFGHEFTDHMLTCEWTADKGWGTPEIKPLQPFAMHPATTVFHYGMEIFEGMKAYIDQNTGQARLFRPEANMLRMNKSAARLCLPTFDPDQAVELIKQLVLVDKSWIPTEYNYSLYIRPTMIATQETLGVGPSAKALWFVILSPVGPYYPTGFAPVKLLATKKYQRAWRGGTGFTKAGGNYASTIMPQREAAADGCAQILWLTDDDRLSEVGTMNMFVFQRGADGKDELITPPLDDGTILPGVTRNSILTLAKEWGEFNVVERDMTMAELLKGLDEGRVHECFGAGTAAIVSPIKEIRFEGKDYPVPLDKADASKQVGPLTARIAETILGIQHGLISRPDWSIALD